MVNVRRHMEVVMALYLMQHGEATTEAENAGRPLTETGRAAVERVAARANAADVRIDRCVHSGKLRAEHRRSAGGRVRE